MIPSLKAAERELRLRLERIADMHERAIASLPDGHSWSDIDKLGIERCDMAMKAHEDFKQAQVEWEAYVVAHADE